MNTKSIIAVLRSANLTTAQAKTLTELILSYAESADLVYEILGALNTGISYKKVVEDLKQEHFGWESSTYCKLRKDRANHDSILEKPPEIREGETECPKCHTKKTLVVEMQTRSADEGYTYYIYCFNPFCKAITK